MESWWLEVTNLKVAQIGLILGLTWKGGKDMTTRLIDSLAKWVFHATRIIPLINMLAGALRNIQKRDCSIDSDWFIGQLNGGKETHQQILGCTSTF
jgi:hypothetical protein